jgi:mannose-1-phosphate guanylyltransferase
MRALLLAAGLGTRLRPLTNTVPKCMVPIKGRPLLEIWLKRLTKAGFGPFLINTHYLAKYVESYLEESIYQKHIFLVYENKLLGTAGTLLSNLDFFENQDGLLIHADNYCLEDFRVLRRAHENRPKECLLTMMTFRTSQPSSCGIVELDSRGVVIGFHEKKKNPPGNLANCAVYVISKEFIKEIEVNHKGAKDFSTEILNNFMGKIYCYETFNTFYDVGTIESYLLANQASISDDI